MFRAPVGIHLIRCIPLNTQPNMGLICHWKKKTRFSTNWGGNHHSTIFRWMLRDGRGQIHRIAIYEATWSQLVGCKYFLPVDRSLLLTCLLGKRYMLFLQILEISPKGKFSDRPEVVVRYFMGS